MTADARTAALRAAAADKRSATLARSRRAIVALENRGKTVNFNTVAAEAGVSKSYLYRQPDLRRVIADRRPVPARTVGASPRASMSAERVTAKKLALASAALKRLRLENEALRGENARLRGDLAQERRRSTS